VGISRSKKKEEERKKRRGESQTIQGQPEESAKAAKGKKEDSKVGGVECIGRRRFANSRFGKSRYNFRSVSTFDIGEASGEWGRGENRSPPRWGGEKCADLKTLRTQTKVRTRAVPPASGRGHECDLETSFSLSPEFRGKGNVETREAKTNYISTKEGSEHHRWTPTIRTNKG